MTGKRYFYSTAMETMESHKRRVESKLAITAHEARTKLARRLKSRDAGGFLRIQQGIEGKMSASEPPDAPLSL